MRLVVSPDTVRDYLRLNSPGSSSQYSDTTLGSNVRAAMQYIERKTHRFFHDHPSVTWATTSMLDTQVSLPGFRTIASCTWGGTVQTVAVPGQQVEHPSAWGLWEPSEGVGDGQRLIVALQFRPWRTDASGPWWLADPGWFDKGLDSPYHPANWGGGWPTSSMPNDLVIVGDGGYAAEHEPEPYLNAVKVLAAWYTLRPSSVLADVSLTPGRNELTYDQMPEEVYEFIADWKAGRMAVGL